MNFCNFLIIASALLGISTVFCDQWKSGNFTVGNGTPGVFPTDGNSTYPAGVTAEVTLLVPVGMYVVVNIIASPQSGSQILAQDVLTDFNYNISQNGTYEWHSPISQNIKLTAGTKGGSLQISYTYSPITQDNVRKIKIVSGKSGSFVTTRDAVVAQSTTFFSNDSIYLTGAWSSTLSLQATQYFVYLGNAQTGKYLGSLYTLINSQKNMTGQELTIYSTGEISATDRAMGLFLAKTQKEVASFSSYGLIFDNSNSLNIPVVLTPANSMSAAKVVYTTNGGLGFIDHSYIGTNGQLDWYSMDNTPGYYKPILSFKTNNTIDGQLVPAAVSTFVSTGNISSFIITSNTISDYPKMPSDTIGYYVSPNYPQAGSLTWYYPMVSSSNIEFFVKTISAGNSVLITTSNATGLAVDVSLNKAGQNYSIVGTGFQVKYAAIGDQDTGCILQFSTTAVKESKSVGSFTVLLTFIVTIFLSTSA